MTRQETLLALADWDRAWSKKWASKITVDSNYSGKERTQYPETAVHLSAPPEADDEFWNGVRSILSGTVPSLTQKISRTISVPYNEPTDFEETDGVPQ